MAREVGQTADVQLHGCTKDLFVPGRYYLGEGDPIRPKNEASFCFFVD